MGRFQVISLFPEMMTQLFHEGVVGQALREQKIALEVINPRQFATGVHQAVDDRPFGGGDGMVMQAEYLELSLKEARKHAPSSRVIYLSPQGERLTDAMVRQWAVDPQLTLICGRYGGVDERFLQKNQIQEVSIGDYVLSGGELAAAVIIDAVSRHVPGVLGHGESAERESFAGDLLEAPAFTRPREWEGFGVPEFLLSGHHARIERVRQSVARFITFKKRPDLKPFAHLSSKECQQVWKDWQSLSAEDRRSLGLTNLSEEDLRRELGGRS